MISQRSQNAEACWHEITIFALTCPLKDCSIFENRVLCPWFQIAAAQSGKHARTSEIFTQIPKRSQCSVSQPKHVLYYI